MGKKKQRRAVKKKSSKHSKKRGKRRSLPMFFLLLGLLCYNVVTLIRYAYAIPVMNDGFVLYWFIGVIETASLFLILGWKRWGIYGILATTIILSWINFINGFTAEFTLGVLWVAAFIYLLKDEYKQYR